MKRAKNQQNCFKTIRRFVASVHLLRRELKLIFYDLTRQNIQGIMCDVIEQNFSKNDLNVSTRRKKFVFVFEGNLISQFF